MSALERHFARFELQGGDASKFHYLDTERPATPATPVQQEPHSRAAPAPPHRSQSRTMWPTLLPITETQRRCLPSPSSETKWGMSRVDSSLQLPSKGLVDRSASPKDVISSKQNGRDRTSSMSTTSDSTGASPSWCSTGSSSASSSCQTPSSRCVPEGSPVGLGVARQSPVSRPAITLPRASSSSPSRPGSSSTSPAALWQGDVRLLLIRHAQSANKGRKWTGKKACPDPELTDLGYEQAQLLGRRMAREFRQKHPNLVIVTSPMRRCLLTILPSVQLLPIPQENCLCHGMCYEYGCVGRHFRGTNSNDIGSDFPDFKLEGFQEDGKWDYRGDGEKEDDVECRARGRRIVDWLMQEAVPLLRKVSKDFYGTNSHNLPTVAFVTHQTIADLLCTLLLESSADSWTYGDISYRLSNACISEIILHPDGTAEMGEQNDGSHLLAADSSFAWTMTATGSGWSSTWGSTTRLGFTWG